MEEMKEVNFINQDQLENSAEVCFTCFKPFTNKKAMGKTELCKLIFCPECCKTILKEEFRDE